MGRFFFFFLLGSPTHSLASHTHILSLLGKHRKIGNANKIHAEDECVMNAFCLLVKLGMEISNRPS